jgi:hypothetical protein
MICICGTYILQQDGTQRYDRQLHGNIWKDQFSHNFIEFLLHTLGSYCLLVISARILKENIENHYLTST